MKFQGKALLLPLIIYLSVPKLYAQVDPSKIFQDFKKYEFKNVYDSTYGIVMYNELILSIGGDSVRYDHKGHNAQGWIEDFYKSDKVLHKGYYVDGQLRVFKNFYENGEVERSFRLSDGKKSAMTIYYPDGKIKSDLTYFGESVTSQVDYFQTGLKEYEEESDKSGLIMWKRISYFPDGFVDNSLEVTDKKKKKYMQKEFYSGGKIKLEGELKLDMATYDYVKEGVWNYYDEKGAITKTEKYHNGRLEGE
jgi:antitoxin component YwqK of YwqJK toxin-antitoxin module